ncbi:MAG: phosphate acyltransferase PlsX [Candidatus Kapaibacteriales bacterium]
MSSGSTSGKTLRIALDAMGGDFAPANEVAGALSYLGSNLDIPVEIVLVGDQTLIEGELKKSNPKKRIRERISIHHTTEVITMDDDASAPLKTKKDSSMTRGMYLCKEGNADAFLSAGNTGAMLATSTIILGRVQGVHRPTIGTFFPTSQGKPTLIIDAGANIDAKPRFLYEFAIMGNLYYKLMFGVQSPAIALLNIGEEPSKGTEAVQEAHKMLADSKLNFIGNLEGRDIFNGNADVMVCDGFVGNIILKFAESFLSFFKSTLENYASKKTFNKLKVGLTVPTLRDVFREFDYQEYGGVPLLGVNGTVIIGHGKSTPKAIHNMISRSVEVVKSDFNKKLEEALA